MTRSILSFVLSGLVLTCLILALIWLFYGEKPSEPLFEEEVTIRIRTDRTEDSLSKETDLKGLEDFLKSKEFLEIVAQQVIATQMVKARQVGPSALWPDLDLGVEAVRDNLFKEFTVARNESNQTLTLRFSGQSVDRLERISECIPSLFVRIKKSEANRKYGEIRSLVRRKLLEFKDRETALVQRIWTLRGSANADSLTENTLGMTENSSAPVLPEASPAETDMLEYADLLAKMDPQTPSGWVALEERIRELQSRGDKWEAHATLKALQHAGPGSEVESVSAEIPMKGTALHDLLNTLVDDTVPGNSALDPSLSAVRDAWILDLELKIIEERERSLEREKGSTEDESTVDEFRRLLARLESDLTSFRAMRLKLSESWGNLERSFEQDLEDWARIRKT